MLIALLKQKHAMVVEYCIRLLKNVMQYSFSSGASGLSKYPCIDSVFLENRGLVKLKVIDRGPWEISGNINIKY
jgi:hypothetical protein